VYCSSAHSFKNCGRNLHFIAGVCFYFSKILLNVNVSEIRKVLERYFLFSQVLKQMNVSLFLRNFFQNGKRKITFKAQKLLFIKLLMHTCLKISK
jgi:hypothetical protein